MRLPGRKGWWAGAALTACLAVGIGCATVPYTKRSQLVLVSESEMQSLGQEAFHQVLSKAAVAKDKQVVGAVTRVGERIARSSERPEYAWEFAVIDDAEMVNAFALPGGKVAVYTGLFPVAEDESGLAAVIGHEVGHVLARHAAERMSQGVLLQLGLSGASVALGGKNPATRDAILQALGLGVQVGVVLPFSRNQESEADRIGLILMAKAGYDPHAALGLWERMEEASRGAPPEFLSTHPSHSTRETQIQAWLPEAMSYYTSGPKDRRGKLPGVTAVPRGD